MANGGRIPPRPKGTGPPAPISVKAEPTPEMWEAYFAALESANDARAGLSMEQETTTFVAPDDGLPIGVLFTGDWHCGAGGVQYDHLRRDMEMLRVDTPTAKARGILASTTRALGS